MGEASQRACCRRTGRLTLSKGKKVIYDAFAPTFDLNEATKKATLMYLIGEEAHGTLRNAVFPQAPGNMTYEALVAELKKYYAKQRRSVAENRYIFHERKQRTRESVQQFIVELERLAADCEYGTFLDEALRDQLIVGLKGEGIRNKLLRAEGLTWKKACSIATSVEAAESTAITRSVRGNINVGASAQKPKHRTLSAGVRDASMASFGSRSSRLQAACSSLGGQQPGASRAISTTGFSLCPTAPAVTPVFQFRSSASRSGEMPRIPAQNREPQHRPFRFIPHPGGADGLQMAPAFNFIFNAAKPAVFRFHGVSSETTSGLKTHKVLRCKQAGKRRGVDSSFPQRSHGNTGKIRSS
ncbi:uncharacterized protein LOC135398878 [Ornithodoros turicata]|uniref:uncharacterized protein LOC135398878 n=1 Tax=Ornithodoros turicata TaxID=34597 RepID=UPI00313A3F1B